MSFDRHMPVFNWSLCHVDHALDLNFIPVLETSGQLMQNMLSYFPRLNNFPLNKPGVCRVWC